VLVEGLFRENFILFVVCTTGQAPAPAMILKTTVQSQTTGPDCSKVPPLLNVHISMQLEVAHAQLPLPYISVVPLESER
jgi:hypothetical protein